MAKIKLENVRKIFQPGETAGLPWSEKGRAKTGTPAVALDGVNLLVHHGETLAALGPSGCGKSTLLPPEKLVYFDGATHLPLQCGKWA